MNKLLTMLFCFTIFASCERTEKCYYLKHDNGKIQRVDICYPVGGHLEYRIKGVWFGTLKTSITCIKARLKQCPTAPVENKYKGSEDLNNNLPHLK